MSWFSWLGSWLGGDTKKEKIETVEIAEPFLVCAIDFGTTYSGYAFSFKEEPTNIHMFRAWGHCMGVQSMTRTPTCCLTNRRGEFKAFGFEAQEEYIHMDQEEINECNFCDKFKMILHTKKNISRTTNIEASNGRQLLAMDIFEKSIRYLSQHMQEAVKRQTASYPRTDQVRWVITVPAIWSEASKQFMREAAHKAGITNTVNSTNLVIALEPEAASLSIHKLCVKPSRGSSQEPVKLQVGTKYILACCGGGTLDVAVHQLQSDNKVVELYHPTGGDLGGVKVDEQFEGLFRKVFGSDVMDRYKKDYPAHYVKFVTNLEDKKRAVNPKTNQPTNIQLSINFLRTFENVTGKKLEDAISDEWRQVGMRISGGHLRIPHATMLELFEPVVRAIVNHIKELFDHRRVKGVKHMLLVGGFAESAVLKEAIRREFDELIIVVPDEASLCVLKGATLFGHDISCVGSRRAKYTYGTDICPMFDQSKHDPKKTKDIDNVRRADGVFDIWIKKGATMGEALSFSYFPVLAEQTKMNVGIYSSDLRDPKYCSDPDVDHVGDLLVDMPGTGLNRKLDVKISFAGTEIIVEARDCRRNGATVNTTINFLYD